MCVKKVSKLLTILLRILLKQNTALPSTGGTSQLFSSIWLFRAWKPYNLLKDIIQTDHPDHSYHLTPWTNWTTLTTPTDQTIYQDKCKTRPSILCVAHQMSGKKRNYSVGRTVPYEMINYKWYLMVLGQYMTILTHTDPILVLGHYKLVLLV